MLDTVEIFCDSENAIALSKNNVHHERTKHVQNKYHFIKEKIEEGIIRVTKIGTLINPADIFTKVVPVRKMVEALHLSYGGKFVWFFRTLRSDLLTFGGELLKWALSLMGCTGVVMAQVEATSV